jgi:hypothetical protein
MPSRPQQLVSLPLLSLLLLLGCPPKGDDSAEPPEVDTDPQYTPCGAMSCDQAVEICVACNCGGPTDHRCIPVPAGCEEDRSCGCVGDGICSFAPVAAICMDLSEDNTILCETGLD